MTHALFADINARTLRGLLLPYNELSHPSASGTEPVMFSKGTVEIPADVSALNANRLHSQFAPVARFISTEDTDAGIIAHFAVAATADGDQLLLEAADPDVTKRPRLSAELTKLVRNGANAVKATLTGAAFVPQGAFASAALFSIAPNEATQIQEAIAKAVAEAIATITTPQTPTDAPSTDNQQGATMAAAAVVPAGLNSATQTAPLTANSLFAALTAGEIPQDANKLGELFAISTIQHSGPAAVTIGADVQVPQVLGEIWKRRRYERKYIPLFTQAPLTSMKARGWRWVDGKEPVVDDYTGNTSEIPSNAVDTEEVTVDAGRIAGGHKLDRRYRDFGDTTIIESYFDHMTESYSRKSDVKALAAVIAGATALAGVPAPPAGIATGLSAIIDGALAVIAAENTPSCAIVSAELWREIVLTPHDSILGYLNASIGLEEGNTAGFKIIPGPVGAGKVLVGSKESFTTFELSGVPIRIEGLDPHHGAIDPALFGYFTSLVNSAKGLQLVTAYTAP